MMLDKLQAHRNESGQWLMPGIEDTAPVFDRMCASLRQGANFSFSRFGDGEWNCMAGAPGANCDGHRYYPELGERLRAIVLSEPGYLMGMQPLSMGDKYRRKAWVQSFCRNLNIKWINADVLHDASINGRLGDFFEAISTRRILLIGPKHLAGFLPCLHCVIPPKNCWKQYSEVKSALAYYLEGRRDVLVLLCASMMSNVLIDDFKGAPHTFIDCGSVFSPYCGVKNRSYHRNLGYLEQTSSKIPNRK